MHPPTIFAASDRVRGAIRQAAAVRFSVTRANRKIPGKEGTAPMETRTIDTKKLGETARALVAGDKGLLAMDESTPRANVAARRGEYTAAMEKQ